MAAANIVSGNLHVEGIDHILPKRYRKYLRYTGGKVPPFPRDAEGRLKSDQELTPEERREYLFLTSPPEKSQAELEAEYAAFEEKEEKRRHPASSSAPASSPLKQAISNIQPETAEEPDKEQTTLFSDWRIPTDAQRVPREHIREAEQATLDVGRGITPSHFNRAIEWLTNKEPIEWSRAVDYAKEKGIAIKEAGTAAAGATGTAIMKPAYFLRDAIRNQDYNSLVEQGVPVELVQEYIRKQEAYDEAREAGDKVRMRDSKLAMANKIREMGPYVRSTKVLRAEAKKKVSLAESAAAKAKYEAEVAKGKTMGEGFRPVRQGVTELGNLFQGRPLAAPREVGTGYVETRRPRNGVDLSVSRPAGISVGVKVAGTTSLLPSVRQRDILGLRPAVAPGFTPAPTRKYATVRKHGVVEGITIAHPRIDLQFSMPGVRHVATTRAGKPVQKATGAPAGTHMRLHEMVISADRQQNILGAFTGKPRKVVKRSGSEFHGGKVYQGIAMPQIRLPGARPRKVMRRKQPYRGGKVSTRPSYEFNLPQFDFGNIHRGETSASGSLLGVRDRPYGFIGGSISGGVAKQPALNVDLSGIAARFQTNIGSVRKGICPLAHHATTVKPAAEGISRGIAAVLGSSSFAGDIGLKVRKPHVKKFTGGKVAPKKKGKRKCKK